VESATVERDDEGVDSGEASVAERAACSSADRTHAAQICRSALAETLLNESCLCQEGVLGRVDGPERLLGVALGLVREWLFRSAGVQGCAGHAG